ncbi:MAG: NAD(P)H-dependent oxidoreductase [Clostridia bacterium]|nr:NAD(P)H-dependent oxidoreductase [Clostridia bacterium]
MNILVLNGSPKGANSITLQTVLYLQILYPQHHFEILHVGARIKALEKDFSPAVQAVEKADLLLFCYPVYTFIAPSQLHRFIELLKACGVKTAGKFAAQISTSKHFYDVTAHRYIEDNCLDMGMKYTRGLSADMEDLTTQKGQQEAKAFFKYVCWCVKHDVYRPLPAARPAFVPVPAAVPAAKTEEKPGDVVILTDCEEDNTQLQGMIDRFRAVFPRKTRVVNLHGVTMRGGCLGCFHCAADGKCVYTDGFDSYLRNEIQTAESIVYAFTVKDHSMGALFKMYDDRQFCNGHRTVTMGMPVGYIISGDYENEANLRMIVEGRCEVGSNFLAGVANDARDTNRSVDQLAASLAYALKHKVTQPQNFYGIGGMKIFRDLIYQMQGLMKADHKFYKAHGQYDFPQKHKGTVLKMYLVGMLFSNEKLKAKLGGKISEGMVAPYKKVLEEAGKQKK